MLSGVKWQIIVQILAYSAKSLSAEGVYKLEEGDI